MPRLVAFLAIIFCALSAAILSFDSASAPPLVGTIKPLAAAVVPAAQHSGVDHRVIIHDHVHEHSVPDRAKQLREAATAYRLLAAYVAGLPKPAAPTQHSSVTYVGDTPALWVCTMNHESDLRTGSHWTFRNGPFEGAFAMAHSTWLAAASDLGLAGVYPHAYDAPPPAQVKVAEHARARFGSSQWGGLRACGG